MPSSTATLDSSMSVQVKLEIGHKATLLEKPTVEGYTHDWCIFVRGCDGSKIESFVDKVVFHLHDSFEKPKRVVKELPFEVLEKGYGGFPLPIDVYFKTKAESKFVRINYELFLVYNPPTFSNVRVEKITFQNPEEEFRRKLLRGGGTIVDPSKLPAAAASATPTSSSATTSIPGHGRGGGKDPARRSEELLTAKKQGHVAPSLKSSASGGRSIRGHGSPHTSSAAVSSRPSEKSSHAHSSKPQPPPPVPPPPLPTSHPKPLVQDDFSALFGEPIKATPHVSKNAGACKSNSQAAESKRPASQTQSEKQTAKHQNATRKNKESTNQSTSHTTVATCIPKPNTKDGDKSKKYVKGRSSSSADKAEKSSKSSRKGHGEKEVESKELDVQVSKNVFSRDSSVSLKVKDETSPKKSVAEENISSKSADSKKEPGDSEKTREKPEEKRPGKDTEDKKASEQRKANKSSSSSSKKDDDRIAHNERHHHSHKSSSRKHHSRDREGSSSSSLSKTKEEVTKADQPLQQNQITKIGGESSKKKDKKVDRKQHQSRKTTTKRESSESGTEKRTSPAILLSTGGPESGQKPKEKMNKNLGSTSKNLFAPSKEFSIERKVPPTQIEPKDTSNRSTEVVESVEKKLKKSASPPPPVQKKEDDQKKSKTVPMRAKSPRESEWEPKEKKLKKQPLVEEKTPLKDEKSKKSDPGPSKSEGRSKGKKTKILPSTPAPSTSLPLPSAVVKKSRIKGNISSSESSGSNSGTKRKKKLMKERKSKIRAILDSDSEDEGNVELPVSKKEPVAFPMLATEPMPPVKPPPRIMPPALPPVAPGPRQKNVSSEKKRHQKLSTSSSSSSAATSSRRRSKSSSRSPSPDSSVGSDRSQSPSSSVRSSSSSSSHSSVESERSRSASPFRAAAIPQPFRPTHPATASLHRSNEDRTLTGTYVPNRSPGVLASHGRRPSAAPRQRLVRKPSSPSPRTESDSSPSSNHRATKKRRRKKSETDRGVARFSSTASGRLEVPSPCSTSLPQQRRPYEPEAATLVAADSTTNDVGPAEAMNGAHQQNISSPPGIELRPELLQLQNKINNSRDRDFVRRIVQIIRESAANYLINGSSFDFDLMALDRETVSKLIALSTDYE